MKSVFVSSRSATCTESMKVETEAVGKRMIEHYTSSIPKFNIYATEYTLSIILPASIKNN